MTHYYHNPNLLTGDEAAALLGVSRKTVYRWASEGRLSTPFTRSDIEARMPAVRPRGPRRNPHSLRYVAGRHTFRWSVEESQRISGGVEQAQAIEEGMA